MKRTERLERESYTSERERERYSQRYRRHCVSKCLINAEKSVYPLGHFFNRFRNLFHGCVHCQILSSYSYHFTRGYDRDVSSTYQHPAHPLTLSTIDNFFARKRASIPLPAFFNFPRQPPRVSRYSRKNSARFRRVGSTRRISFDHRELADRKRRTVEF